MKSPRIKLAYPIWGRWECSGHGNVGYWGYANWLLAGGGMR